MKKPKSFIVILILTSTFLLLKEEVPAQEYRVPYVEIYSNLNTFVGKVEKGDTTKINLVICNFVKDNYDFFIPSKGSPEVFYIEDPASGLKYAYLGEAGSSSKSIPYSIGFDECNDSIVLYFEKIPSSLNFFNLVAGEKDNHWDFRGINLERADEDIFERLQGKFFEFTSSFEATFNYIFKERWRFLFRGEIKYINDDGQTVLTITDAKIIDPSFASMNYLNYRDLYIERAKSLIGREEKRNAAAGSVIVW